MRARNCLEAVIFCRHSESPPSSPAESDAKELLLYSFTFHVEKKLSELLLHLFIVLSFDVCHNSRDIHCSVIVRVKELGHEDVVALIGKKISNCLVSTTLDSKDVFNDKKSFISRTNSIDGESLDVNVLSLAGVVCLELGPRSFGTALHTLDMLKLMKELY